MKHFIRLGIKSNVLKQGDAPLPLKFNSSLEYAIRNVQETNLELDMKVRLCG